MRNIIILLFILSFSKNVKSQETPSPNELVTKPTIMVFPFFKEGEDIRTILESDINRRIVVTKIKEAFDDRGYSTIDFISKARNLIVSQTMNSGQEDLKSTIIQSSGADIAVEVEYDFQREASGNTVKVILTAYESSTSASLSNKIGQSPYFRSEDVGALAAKATESIVGDFLNVMNDKFADIRKNGKYMAVKFALTENSEINMSTEVGSDMLPLSDIIEEWVSENANGYHILGVSDLIAEYDQVRIPRSDENGKNYTPTRFALEILKFCRTLSPSEFPDQKLGIERVIKGNTIFIYFK